MTNKKDKEVLEAELQENRVRHALLRGKPNFESLGAGYINKDGKETFYFGTVIYDGRYRDAVVTADKKIFVDWGIKNNEIKEFLGIEYRFPLYYDCIDYSWSNESIDHFLHDNCLEEEHYEPRKLCEELRYKNKELMCHNDTRVNLYVALDIQSSYYLPVCEAKGRTYFEAKKRSGKTRQMQIYDLTAFNPIMSSDLSGASFYRVIESTKGTLLIDDLDAVEKEQKLKLIQHIRTGYKKGAKAVRSDGGTSNRPVGYNNFAHVVLNNTLGLDEITIDRCFTVLLLETKNKKITSKKLDVTNPDWQLLRDRLHISTLLNFKKFKKEYDELEVECLENRELEVVAPVLAMAKVCGEDIYKEVLNFITETYEQSRIQDYSDNWDFILFKHLYETINEDAKIKLKEIANELAPALFNPESKD